MEKYIALIGAVGLIFFTLVTVSLAVNFFIKGFYVYSYKIALKSQDAERPPAFEFADLLEECEEQKVWLCLIWQRPLATLSAAALAALAVRMNLGLSVSLGLATLTFLVFGILLPKVLPSLPTLRLFSKPKPAPSEQGTSSTAEFVS